MSWVLVHWVKEDEKSVIPASWVVFPSPMPSADDLPLDGVCFWKNRRNEYDARLLAISDSKKTLDSLLDASDCDSQYSDSSLRSIPPVSTAVVAAIARKEKRKIKSTAKAVEAAQTSTDTKKSKGSGAAKKNKKLAEAAAVKEAYTAILECKECARFKEELKHKDKDIDYLHKQLEEYELRCMQAEKSNNYSNSTSEIAALKLTIQEMESSLADKGAAIEAKKTQINYLQSQLDAVSSTKPPTPPPGGANFLKALCHFYDTVEEEDFDSSSDNSMCEYEKVRHKNIEKNKRLIESLQIQKPSTPRQNSSQKRIRDAEDYTEIPVCKVQKTSRCSYDVKPADLQKEQEAFQAGEGKKELVQGFGVYIRYVDLEQAEQQSKNSATGLMRSLMSVYYGRERLAACSANSGINITIRTAVFKYCEDRYPMATADKLKRDLTSKCCEERRKLKNR